ncbi:serine hydrolase [Brevibacillus panacihumi]|uniref:Serine hydrolase n=1 Tax=Brevibacillus panacihumi TaxID=497735 RepID=A0A3M8CYB7_9BACL|nr:serine hydrolase [Brevibacillus panacihumi]RNB80826.1 serine hydrolase [Brevibacillus panacihumi]
MHPLEAYARKLMEDAKLPGAFIGIAKDGELQFTGGLGYRDQERQTEITPDTVFGIGSITKSFTCVAIMQLQEAGKLSVHDPVVTYLPEFRTKDEERTKRITIAHLMSHTSGLPSLPTLYYAMRRSMEMDPAVQENQSSVDLSAHAPIDTYEQLMAFIDGLEVELLGEPGTEFSYSNDGYSLLGAIIERVSGQSYESYMKEHIFDPAGMEHTVFLIEDLGDYDNITTLYTSKKGDEGKEVFAAPLWWDAPSMRAAGFIKSTGRDMLAYAEIFRTGGMVGDVRILSEESVRQMIGNYAGLEPSRHYGYGFMVTPNFRGGTLIEHGGAIKGVAAQLCIIPEQGIACVVLTNLDGSPSAELLAAAINTAQSLPVEEPIALYPDYSVSADLLNEFIGEYRSGEGEKVQVSLNDEGLELQFQGMTLPLRAVKEDSFVFKLGTGQERYIRFIRSNTGEVSRVAFHFRQLIKEKEEA